MITNKTSLIISNSKVKNELKILKNSLYGLDETTIELFYSSLIVDVGVLINLFNITSDNEYELMFLSGVVIDITSIFGNSDSNIQGTSVVSNWDKLSTSQKENQKSLILKLSKSSDFFYSIQICDKIKEIKTDNVKKLILLISDFLIQSDGIATEFEKSKRKEIESLIHNSSDKVYSTNQKLIEELLFQNSISIENGEVILAKVTDLKKILSLNQTDLMNFDPKLIQKSILGFKFLGELENTIRESEKKLNNSSSTELVETFFESLYSEIRMFNYLFLIISKQIENSLNKDYIGYYEVDSVLDKMGLYVSNSEKTTHELLKKISDGQEVLSNQLKLISIQLSSIESGINKLNQNVLNLTKSVLNLERTIKDGFQELSFNLQNIGNSINQGFDSLTENLNQINSSIQYNNLISTVNAYQNYKINSKLTKLLE